MSIDTILTVKPHDLERLSAEEAVTIFRELLWAEATAIGVAKNLINVPGAITVPDGGIDAEVRGTVTSKGQGIIKEGLTRYQIKTGEFNLGQERYVNDILLKEKTNELKPRVKSCLDKGGTFVIVLFGWDNPETSDDQLDEKFRSKLTTINPLYAKANIEIWRQNNLISFLSVYPSLALRVSGRQSSRFESHTAWSNHQDMMQPFESGEQQNELIAQIRAELRRDEEPIHIRVLGEPGIGKTRLVLEATRADDLAPLVIYSSANTFQDSDLMAELLRKDGAAILVLDECDTHRRAYIWNRFYSHSPRIKFISIYNEQENTSGIALIETSPLNDEQIAQIINRYSIPKDKAREWARECSGSPRVAHVIGQNLVTNPEDIFKSPATVNIWDRFIEGLDQANSIEVQQRRLVLQYISLFKRFGFGREIEAEARLIQQLICKNDPQITWPRFQKIISDLRRRKILQGENTLYITPRLLHIKMWVEWWDTYGNGTDVLELIAHLSGTLQVWFFEMFEYAAGSYNASAIVSVLLGEYGLFQQESTILKTNLGGRFFFNLASANQREALHCLKKTVGTWSKEELLAFTSGRRQVINALEEIAKWRDLFVDAARILLALAEAENESWANNASGIFAELFAISRSHQLAKSEASPKERFVVIREAIESDKKEHRLLGLKACNNALHESNWGLLAPSVKIVGKQPSLWAPKTYGELYEAFRQVWQYLSDRIDKFSEDEKNEATRILLQNARYLGTIDDLTSMVQTTLQKLQKYVSREDILEVVIEILRYHKDRMSTTTRDQWENIKQQLIGSTFHELLRRYVVMNNLEEQIDDKGNVHDRLQEPLEKLAKQAIDRNLLLPELVWLTTTEAKQGFRFGYELAKKDPKFDLLLLLIKSQKSSFSNTSVLFIGGYLRFLYEQDSARWESLLDEFCTDPDMSVWVPELTWRSGNLSDRAALRITKLIDTDIISPTTLQMFIYGNAIQLLTEDVLIQWVERLLSDSDAWSISIALALFSHYYGKSSKLIPEELTLKLLTSSALLANKDGVTLDAMTSYYWEQIGEAFIAWFPQRTLDLAEFMLEHFSENGTIFSGINSRTESILFDICRRFPSQVWKIIIKYIDFPLTSRGYRITHWLRGDDFIGGEMEGALSLIPAQEVWQWVEENREERAWYLASFVPKKLFVDKAKICWARELLMRYGDDIRVRRNLISNFSTEGWTGHASLHYQAKQQSLLEFRQSEEHEAIKSWIDEYVILLDDEIRQAKISEERESY